MQIAARFSRNLIHYGDAAMQFGELRLPVSSNNEPLPLVIIIHGGCWVTAFADYVISLAGIATVLGTNSCNTLANDVISVPITEYNNDLFSRLNETSPLQILPTYQH